MSYSISGPGDISVISRQPAGLGIIQLTLQIPATAAPGARTLFIQNTTSTVRLRQVFCKFSELGRRLMTFVQRRRFLWVLPLIGMALVAAVARATPLVHLRFQELVDFPPL
jgi:hypothetical protein